MKTDKEFKKLASFWIGPLLAGSCLATGYEVTHRVMILNSKLQLATSELFQTQNPLPGKGIEDLKQIHANAHKTKLSTQEQNLLSRSTAFQAKRMQLMLDALETSEINAETPHKSQQQRSSAEFNTHRAQGIFKKQTFEKLFKALPKP